MGKEINDYLKQKYREEDTRVRKKEEREVWGSKSRQQKRKFGLIEGDTMNIQNVLLFLIENSY